MLRPRIQLPGKRELLEEVAGAIARGAQRREAAFLLDVEGDVEMLGGAMRAQALRPLDDDHAVALLPDLLEAERAEVGGVEAVEVEVVKREPAVVLVKEREGGAGDAIGDGETLGEALGEGGLAGSEIPVEQEDVAGLDELTEERPQALGRFGVG